VLSLPERVDRAPLLALWAPLIAGARVVIPEADDAVNGAEISRLIKGEEVTLLHASPEGWRALIGSGQRAGRSLRAHSSGGALSQESADEILARCRVLWNSYGTAETAGCATLGRIEPPSLIVVGRPIANTRVYVVDADGRPVPIGAVGELLIAGDGVATEYVNRPECNEATFVEAPQEDGPVFRSGDRGRWLSEGVLQVVARETA
jgi:non-ribosomal peptide synthetase component F